jgi:TRAP-type C4-dicarboxylate transport system permease small subunit
VARFLLVWLTFLGATVAYYRGANPGVDALYNRLSVRGRRACKIAVYLLSLVFFAIMIIYGAQFAYFVRAQISPALRLPKWIPHSVIPIAGSVMFLHALNFLTRALREGRGEAP